MWKISQGRLWHGKKLNLQYYYRTETLTASTLSTRSRQVRWAAAILLLVFLFLFAGFGSLAAGSLGFIIPGVFFLIFIVIIIIVIANAAGQGGPRIQRPSTEQTAFPPPPPPDTILVKCPYCNTSQPFQEKCANCGAPLPKPGLY